MVTRRRKKALLVFGTRPEAIKMCPLVKELMRRGHMETGVCVTAQHRHMLDQVLEIFKITPDYDLNIMHAGQSLYDITGRVLSGMRGVLEEYGPDLVFVHGDTTTAFAAALSAFYRRIPVAHVEAGLRTYNLDSPYPEEYNRQAISLTARYHFAPTGVARDNLLREGRPPASVYVTGNTGIDAMKTTVRADYHSEITDWAAGSRLLVVTAHRRENLGAPMHSMFRAIRRVVDAYSDVKAVYPVHMNPAVRAAAEAELAGSASIRLIEPLGVADFHNLLNHACLILTDSGGIQEEAPALGKPVLVMRDTTERPEGVTAGTLRLVGTQEAPIYEACKLLLDDAGAYGRMSRAKNPYGDGTASEKIADAIDRDFLALP